jgi:hypothetical protein
MLSKDELSDGRIFILKLSDTAGVSSHWVQRLRGDVARRWYDIYRSSDWPTLRREAADVFRNPITQDDSRRISRKNRCVIIQTPAVLRTSSTTRRMEKQV